MEFLLELILDWEVRGIRGLTAGEHAPVRRGARGAENLYEHDFNTCKPNSQKQNPEQ